jgi:hypothetical protein
MKRLCLSVVIGLVAMVLPQVALAQGFEPLPGRTETTIIEGQQVNLGITPEIKVTTAGDKNRLDLRVRISLVDLQAKAASILNSMVAQQSDGVRWSFPQLAAPVAADGALNITGTVRAETEAFGLAVQETANFVLALRPLHTATMITVAAELEHLEVGRSVLGDLGLEGLLRDLVAEELSNALSGEGALFTLPEELLVFGFTIVDVAVVDTGSGEAELVALAATELDGPQLARALATLATILSE